MQDVSAHNANELVALVQGGFRPRRATPAAAVEAAALLRRRGLGEIAVGATTDFVVIDGDPLKNPELLARPTVVLNASREL